MIFIIIEFNYITIFEFIISKFIQLIIESCVLLASSLILQMNKV